MRYFRNVQDKGRWKRGGTYTFEFNSTVTEREGIGTGEYIFNSNWSGSFKYYNGWYICHKKLDGSPILGGEYVQSLPYQESEAPITPVNPCTAANGFTPHTLDQKLWNPDWPTLPPPYPEDPLCAEAQFISEGQAIYNDNTQNEDFRLPYLSLCGSLPLPYGSGNILFDNNNQNFLGGVTGLTVLSTEELADGWMKYTVQVSDDLANGIYYVKSRNYYYGWFIE